jgi:plastocyanin
MVAVRVFVAALLAVGLGLDEPASRLATGTIRGRLTIGYTPRPVERPSIADPTARRPDTVDRRKSVVYLDSVPLQAFTEVRSVRARMDQRGEQFHPRVLAITVGSTVDFPNNDITFHNVFSLSRVKPFDLGRYKPGKSGAIVFDRPGIVPVFCDIHSHMSAYILVFIHPFFAVTDDNGDYAISGIPPGTYSVTVWSELGKVQSRLVTLSGSETVEADFRVSRDGS